MSSGKPKRTAFPPEGAVLAAESPWVEDLLYAWQEARRMAIISSFILGILMFQLLTSYSPSPWLIGAPPVPLIRPHLKGHEITIVRNDLQNSQTTFHLHGTLYSLKHFKSVTEDGNFHPPDIFYRGVFFGISESSSHQFEYLNHENITSLRRNISNELLSLNPLPTSVHQRMSRHDNCFIETGYGLFFNFDDLKRVGWLSSDVKQPWKRILGKIIDLGVRLDIPYILLWHPNRYGKQGDERYEHIVQSIIPTRTGYSSLRSSRAVWLSAVNLTAPIREPAVFRKEWTQNDHWTHYPLHSPTEL